MITFKKAGSLFLGVLLSAGIISSIHVFQGFIFDNWSGLHPYYRFYFIINYVILGVLVGITILIFLHFLKIKIISSTVEFFKYGLLLGSMGLSAIVRPWLNFEYLDFLLFIIITVISFFTAQGKIKH